MSYILEALRKAEQERNLGRVPDLQTAATPIPQARRRLWPLFLGLALVINGTVLTVLLLPDYLSRFVSPAKQSAIPIVESVTPSSNPITEYMPVQEISNARTDDSTPPPVSPPPSGPARDSQAAIPEPAPAPETIAIPLPSTLPTPTVSSLDHSPASSSVLALQALPMEFRRAFPKLNLDVHVYSAAIHKRFVLINSKRYQEGDRLSEGPLLESITADGAVLSYQGQRFLLPVYQ
jgi:general secretion pathway protein B